MSLLEGENSRENLYFSCKQRWNKKWHHFFHHLHLHLLLLLHLLHVSWTRKTTLGIYRITTPQNHTAKISHTSSCDISRLVVKYHIIMWNITSACEISHQHVKYHDIMSYITYHPHISLSNDSTGLEDIIKNK